MLDAVSALFHPRDLISALLHGAWRRPQPTDPSERPTKRVSDARNHSDLKWEELEKIVEELRAEGKMWHDPEFKADDSSLFEDPRYPPEDWLRQGERGKVVKNAQVTWQTPDHFCATKRPMGVNWEGKPTWLYTDDDKDEIGTSLDIDSNEICQGSIGDCYFISALACATRDLLLADSLIDETFEDVGIYGVSFWVGGKWEMVWVDSFFPCYRPKSSSHSGRWRLIFASCADPKEIWPLVVEKAYAKLKGSYEELNGGRVGDALVALTGGDSHCIYLQSFMGCSKPKVWKALVNKGEFGKEGVRFVGAGTRHNLTEAEGHGIVSKHAYSILNAKECTTVQSVKVGEGEDGEVKREEREVTTRILKLRNPWNKGEWKGAWSDGSREWQSEEGKTLLEQINAEHEERGEQGKHSDNDGEFWMSLEDFMAIFSTLDYCDCEQEGRAERVEALKEHFRSAATDVTNMPDDVKNANNQMNSASEDKSIDDLMAFIDGPKETSKKHEKKGKKGHHGHH